MLQNVVHETAKLRRAEFRRLPGFCAEAVLQEKGEAAGCQLFGPRSTESGLVSVQRTHRAPGKTAPGLMRGGFEAQKLPAASLRREILPRRVVLRAMVGVERAGGQLEGRTGRVHAAGKEIDGADRHAENRRRPRDQKGWLRRGTLAGGGARGAPAQGEAV